MGGFKVIKKKLIPVWNTTAKRIGLNARSGGFVVRHSLPPGREPTLIPEEHLALFKSNQVSRMYFRTGLVTEKDPYGPAVDLEDEEQVKALQEKAAEKGTPKKGEKKPPRPAKETETKE